jgi:hypothetical protein
MLRLDLVLVVRVIPASNVCIGVGWLHLHLSKLQLRQFLLSLGLDLSRNVLKHEGKVSAF